VKIEAPTFSVPLAATLVAVATASGFSLAVTAVIAASPPVEQPWPIVAGLFYALAALSWAGLLHAIGTRRTFRGCTLHLEAGGLRPDELTSFAIADPHRRLHSARDLGLSLAWREKSTRVGGRKVYTEGPYELHSPVRWEHRDALPSAGGSGLTGDFRVTGSDIKLKQLAQWSQQAEILLRVRTGRWRSCFFVLTLEGLP
jgi:hypothetical protein